MLWTLSTKCGERSLSPNSYLIPTSEF
jgi:hypothetical protein